MPDRQGRINGMERRFIDAYAKTGDGMYAARQAGYAHPAQRAAQNLEKPVIQAEIVRTQLAILTNELLPESMVQARRLLTDPGTPAGARANVVKMIWDRSFGTGDASAVKELHEMTLEELDKRRQQLMSEAANQAKTIDHEPDSAPKTHNIMD